MGGARWVRARAWCGASILNAIPVGVGCSFALSIPVSVAVRLGAGRSGRPDPLVSACIDRVLPHAEKRVHRKDIDVDIFSPVPPSMGLKTSSAVSNAVCLALTRLLDLPGDKMDCITYAVDASIDAGVSITGAFDDACASMLAGVYLTDNRRRSILARYDVPAWDVVVYLPAGAGPRSKRSLDIRAFLRRKREYLRAVRMAKSGDLVGAMRLNGITTAEVLGDDVRLIEKVLDAGASAGGVTGTGPAMVFVLEEGDKSAFGRVMRLLEERGEVMPVRPARSEADAEVVE